MTDVRAVYEGGVFKPVDAVLLNERQFVTLRLAPVSAEQQQPDETAVRRWRATLDSFHAEILAQSGRPFPDSTSDIAADRAYGRGL